jgi:hypothetical protein
MDVLTTPPLALADWLSVIEREYLSDFVPAGGAALKIAILDDTTTISAATAHLCRLGQANGMLTVQVDAARTRVHMMQELFFAITRALPWDNLLQHYLEKLFETHAYPWPRPNQVMSVAELAAEFAVAPNLLARHLDEWLTADLWDDRRLAQDFRAAMMSLCLSRLEPDGWKVDLPALLWLRGEKVAPTLLRGADIWVRLTRTSARPMLASLCHLLRKTCAAGLLVVLDLRRLLQTAAAEDTLRYSPAAVMDAYEVLREIIDETEQLPGLFLAVLADPALATGDPRRSLSQYAALQMRVWPDVRPGDRQNPVAPLVWLAA